MPPPRNKYLVCTASTDNQTTTTYDATQEDFFLAQHTPGNDSPAFSSMSILHQSSPPTDSDDSDALFSTDNEDLGEDEFMQRIRMHFRSAGNSVQAMDAHFKLHCANRGWVSEQWRNLQRVHSWRLIWWLTVWELIGTQNTWDLTYVIGKVNHFIKYMVKNISFSNTS